MGIFNPAIFNNAVFNTEVTARTGPIPGGFTDLPTGRRSKRDIEEARQAFGVIPKKVERVIERVAEQQIPEEDHAQALLAALERRNVAYRALYLERLRFEIALRQEREEEEIIALVLLMH